MATDKHRKPEPKNQKLIVVIICCVSIFIFPFVSDSEISFPGFEHTPTFSGQIFDKNGKSVRSAYVLYEYRASTPKFPEGSDTYIINPTIAITDANGKFQIQGLSQRKPWARERARLEFFGAYSPVTHCSFGIDTTSQNYQKITLGDNSNDTKAWEKDLKSTEKGYGWFMFMVGCDQSGRSLVVTNKEEFEAMIQSEHRLLNERKGNDDVTLDSLKKEFEFSVLRDKLSLAIHNKITENLYTNNFDGAIAVYTTVIEQKPGFFYAYVGRGELKKEKGDLNGALDDYNTALNMQPSYILGRLERGELEKEMGNFDAATADYDMVIKRPFAYQGRDFVKGSDLIAFGYEGRGFVKQAQGDLIGAQADFNQAMKLYPTMLAPILTNVDSMSITNSK